MLHTKWLILLFGLVVMSQAVKRFRGGALTLTFLNSTSPDRLKARMDIITGWHRGQGPCGPSCTAQREGSVSNTVAQRAILDQWSTEIWTNVGITQTNITALVNQNIHGWISAVSEKWDWTQEIASFPLEFDINQDSTDIILHGGPWMDLQLQNCHPRPPSTDCDFHLQLKALLWIRNDTGSPNNAPRVLFKPLYRVPINFETRLHVAVLDPEDDAVLCRSARWVELSNIEALRNTTITSTCEIIIRPFAKDGVKIGDLGIINMIVEDSVKESITMHRPKMGDVDQKPQSTMNQNQIQFVIEIVQDNTVPNFQSPSFCAASPSSSDLPILVVYVGATLETTLVAGTHQNSSRGTYIERFRVTSLPYRKFSVTSPKYVTGKESEGVRQSVMTWSPDMGDVGQHLMQIVAIDSQGYESVDCSLQIHVNHVVASETTSAAHKIVFVDFPQRGVIECHITSHCVFPVYATSEDPTGSHITFIQVIDEGTDSDVIIKENQSRGTFDVHGKPVSHSDVTVVSDQFGYKNVCVQAIDSKGHTARTCTSVSFITKDPCSRPRCERNKGDCRRNDTSPLDYTCECMFGYRGKNCEIEIDPCAEGFCGQNSRLCGFDPVLAPEPLCLCEADFTGKRCEYSLSQVQQSTCMEISCNKSDTQCANDPSLINPCTCDINVAPWMCDPGMLAAMGLSGTSVPYKTQYCNDCSQLAQLTPNLGVLNIHDKPKRTDSPDPIIG